MAIFTNQATISYNNTIRNSNITTGQILTVSGGFGLATPVYGDLADKLNRR